MRYLNKIIIVLLLVAGNVACSDFLSPSIEQNKVTGESVNTESDLAGLMIGAYNHLTDVNYFGRDFIVNGEARTDNAFSNGNSGRFTESSFLTYTDTDVEDLWQDGYQAISNANIIINSDVPSSPQVDYIKGQAYGLRAMVHMDLLTTYGQAYVEGSDKGIPYVTTYNEDDLYPSRGSVQETWDKIGADFQEALSLMDTELDGANTSLTYYGVRALQARYFLTIGENESAAEAAKGVIDNGGYQLASAADYESAWATDGNNNTIFELAFSTSDRLSFDNLARIYQNTSYGDIEVTEQLYNLYEPGDVRLDLYETYQDEDGNDIYRIVGKYPLTTGEDNIRVIRYAEVILTYAEAEARLGNTAEAKIYLDMITSNRNASDYTVASIENILLERRKELAMEGHRFYDLMRTGQRIVRDVDIRNNYDLTVPYGDYRLAYPIPKSELDANTNLKQNKGY